MMFTTIRFWFEDRAAAVRSHFAWRGSVERKLKQHSRQLTRLSTDRFAVENAEDIRKLKKQFEIHEQLIRGLISQREKK